MSKDINTEPERYVTRITAMLPKMKEQEREIMTMRWGIAPYDKPHSLTEVSKATGLTRERIRVMETNILRRKG